MLGPTAVTRAPQLEPGVPARRPSGWDGATLGRRKLVGIGTTFVTQTGDAHTGSRAHDAVMDLPELIDQLAEADERRRDAAPGTTTQRDAEAEVERLARMFTRQATASL